MAGTRTIIVLMAALAVAACQYNPAESLGYTMTAGDHSAQPPMAPVPGKPN